MATKRMIDEIAYVWVGCKITWIGEPLPWTIISVTIAGNNELSVLVRRDGMLDRTLTVALDDDYEVVMNFDKPF